MRPTFLRMRPTGFTTIELVMVLVVVSVLAAAAFGRWGSGGDNTVAYQADELARNLRHAQLLALTWNRPLRLSLSGGNTYSVACVTSGPAPCNASPVIDPATGAAFSITLQSGVTLTGASVDLDTLGRPSSGGAVIATTPARSYGLSGGSNTATVTLSPLTGFTTISY